MATAEPVSALHSEHVKTLSMGFRFSLLPRRNATEPEAGEQLYVSVRCEKWTLNRKAGALWGVVSSLRDSATTLNLDEECFVNGDLPSLRLTLQLTEAPFTFTWRTPITKRAFFSLA